MIYLILTSKDDDSNYSLVVIDKSNNNHSFSNVQRDRVNNNSENPIIDKTNNTNFNELPTNYSNVNNLENQNFSTNEYINNNKKNKDNKQFSSTNMLKEAEKNILENFMTNNHVTNISNDNFHKNYIYSNQLDINKSHSNCECYIKKFVDLTDNNFKDENKIKHIEDDILYNNEEEDQKLLLPQIKKKFDLEKFNRYKHIYIKNLIIKFNSNQSLLSLFVKGFLKATSKPWEILLDLFTPKSNKGFLLIIKFIIPLFFIWNFSEVELFILEKIMSRLKVPPSFLGLTIMSWGNNAPDMYNVASAMAKGLVDLALNAAIASEIHNILLGLGLPWLVYNLRYKNTIEFKMNDLYACTFLFFCVFLLILIVFLKINKYKFDFKLACVLILIYLVFLILIFVLSFNIKLW